MRGVYMMDRNHQMRGGALQIHCEQESPNEGRLQDYMMNRNHQTRGIASDRNIYIEREREPCV